MAVQAAIAYSSRAVWGSAANPQAQCHRTASRGAMTEEAYPDALRVGYRLHWFVLEHVLGQGGFGITYLARDTNLDRRVAIKEYLPSDIARRRADASAHPNTESHSERYAWGLERFLTEARTLARFDHPNIVRVYSVFEANNTAYMVMRFEEGEALSTLLARCGTLSEPQLLGTLLPILDGLQLVHDSGFIHRDIKPDNIYVRQDGSPVLLDFGSARQSFGSTKTMTILVAPGYAPLEQYYGDAETQGPWTDIYGLGATCYRAITGKAPLDAIARAKGVLGSAREVLPPAVVAGRGRYGERLLAGVDHALQLNDRDRPRCIADWRLEIVGPAVSTPPPSVAPDVRTIAPRTLPHGENSKTDAQSTVPTWRSPLVRNLLAMAGALAAVSWFVINGLRTPPTPTPSPQPLQATASEASVAAASVPAPSATPVLEVIPMDAAPAKETRSAAPDVVPIAPRAAHVPAEREARASVGSTGRPAMPTSESTSTLTSTSTPTKAAPESVPLSASLPPPATAQLPAPTPASAATPPIAVPVVARENAPAHNRLRDDQLSAAEAALRRGDAATAAGILTPLAAAGVPRAQAMLGHAKEDRSGQQQSDFEAYIWYSLAARGGEPGAQALRDKVAAKLQPAEIRQAEQVIARWKPRAESTASASH